MEDGKLVGGSKMNGARQPDAAGSRYQRTLTVWEPVRPGPGPSLGPGLGRLAGHDIPAAER